MKSISTLLRNMIMVALVLFCQTLSAQTLKDFFNSPDVSLTYLGIDFTRAKVLNEITVNAGDIKDRQYPGMNNVVVSEKEAKKWDMAKFFSRNQAVANDISEVTEKNAKIDEDKIMENSADELRLNKSSIESIVKGYSFFWQKRDWSFIYYGNDEQELCNGIDVCNVYRYGFKESVAHRKNDG